MAVENPGHLPALWGTRADNNRRSCRPAPSCLLGSSVAGVRAGLRCNVRHFCRIDDIGFDDAHVFPASAQKPNPIDHSQHQNPDPSNLENQARHSSRKLPVMAGTAHRRCLVHRFDASASKLCLTSSHPLHGYLKQVLSRYEDLKKILFLIAPLCDFYPWSLLESKSAKVPC